VRNRTIDVKPDARLVADDRLGILFVLWLVGRSTIDLSESCLEGLGIAADEFPVYCLLEIEAPLTPAALGKWMAAPPTTVSALVRRLERRGHVNRSPNPADGRSVLLELTPSGRRAQGAAAARFGPVVAEVEGRLGRREPRMKADLLDVRAMLDEIRALRATDAKRGAKLPTTKRGATPPPLRTHR
jgi:DNA-binding MarR family transcriptional regulator